MKILRKVGRVILNPPRAAPARVSNRRVKDNAPYLCHRGAA